MGCGAIGSRHGPALPRSPYAHLPEEREAGEADNGGARRSSPSRGAEDGGDAEARRARRTTALRPLLTPLIDYVMLLVGQTGCGKTSLVDLLAGLDVVIPEGPETKEALVRFAEQAISDGALEATPDDAMSSKTSDARAYRLKLGHVGLTVIDTPGFGDTRGRATDETHVKKILACLENVGAINCVVLTINGREARISATLRYALTMLTSVLPKGVLSSNVAVVFTNTENERQLNFSRGELAKFGIPSPASVCLNNPLCELQRALLAPGDVSGDLVRESFVLVERTLETVAALMEQIRNFEPVPTLEFKKIHEKRLEIEGILGDLHARYAEEEKRLSDIRSIKADILSTGEVSPVTRTAIEWRLHKQGGPCYVCLHPDCHSNCHEATLSFLSSVYCWANRDGVCSTCGHRFGSHQVSSSRWRGDAKTEIVNLGDIQRARSEKEKRETAVRALEEQIRGGQEAKARLSAELFDTLDEYAELGLPDAYKRVLRTQEACLSQELEARPDDTTLEDMLRRVRRYLAELESSPWREPVKGVRQRLVDLEEAFRPPPASWQWQGRWQSGGGGPDARGEDADGLRQRRVRVPEMDGRIRELLLRTQHPKHARGCRGQDGSSLWLAKIKRVKVWRLEHPLLWQQFGATSRAMRRQLRDRGSPCPAVDPPILHLDTADAETNEVFLWHGTRSELLPTIREWGLDERVCSLDGLHGAGLYFASESCKAAQYAPPAADGRRHLLYVRVLLGLSCYVRDSMKGARRPPPDPGSGGRLCDSVIANAGVANGGRQVHREFVVYDRRQAYPEFEVEIEC